MENITVPISNSNKPYLTPNQAAALLMVSPATLRVWADKGLLKAHTTAGGHRRFLRCDLERFQQVRAQARDEEPATVAAHSETNDRRILIVDDDAALSRYLSAFLAEHEHVLSACAHDGFTAGQLVLTFCPDTILLDLMMPSLDGFQVCRRIKEDPATQAIRIIAMTGYDSAENSARILDAGAERCLSKPLDETLLLSALHLPLPD